jgi:3-phenylpropionate/cinnamic acid dioxygenase small subunit
MTDPSNRGGAVDVEAAVQAIIDRQQIVDTLLRYASSVDRKDYRTLRSTLADDAVAQYGEGSDVIEGGDTITSWIDQMTVTKAWQHHLLNVYHVDIDGDEARCLTYHTSHQADRDAPDTVHVIVARYHDVVRRVDGAWKIADKRMELCWMEQREFPQSAMSEQTAAEQESALARAEGGR